MATDFVHLHLHTDYSMLDGACKAAALADKAHEYGMDSMAVTDHGNMCGAFEFYTAMKKAGIRPIIGCEMYMAPGRRDDRSTAHPHHKGYHLLMLARDAEGYRNLCRLNAIAHLEGFYFKPRIDRESLAKHAAGLIGTSACLGGEIPTLLLEGQEEKAEEALSFHLEVLGRDNFYLELQDHGMREQKELNAKLLRLSKRRGVPLVATNDTHYLDREHAAAHDVLLCIGTQKNHADENRIRFPSEEFYLKSGAEMEALFAEVPEALRNTRVIAERCHVELEKEGANHYPVYQPPDGSPREAYIRRLCVAGLIERYGFDAAGTADGLTEEQRTIVARMNYELGVIAEMGFTSYFLVVWDFLDYARRQGIPIGPGRGSGAGSLVAYLLRITDIDPLRYNLLFERFLNPERVSPPDFDIDLCERRRYEVIEYVRQRYGEDCVAQIGTFGTLKAKAVIKDVSRVMGRTFDEGNRLTKMIPADPKMTLTRALSENSELGDYKNRERWVQEVFEYSTPLEGLNRNMSIHAAGVIIGDQPLTNLVPLGRGQNNEVITQYQAGPCEALGLLKMDFLGLRTLTIVQDACDAIRKNRGVDLDISAIPLDDRHTYELLQRGETVCVFQLESSGMQDLCRRFGVERIEDIIALIALYRPGPMQFLEDFIGRKSGRVPVEYDVPAMRPILEETYGIMLYQEQVMQVVQTVAGFTLGHADIVRRAMGKKKVEAMQAQFEQFREGCAANNIPASTAAAIWDKIEKFAGYGFNKSHSAAYGFLAYRTAYLKANYPVEFMAANLTAEMGSSERVAVLIGACREMGIRVLPPDVSKSDLSFTVDGESIRFGLAAIKGVGAAAAQAILEARKAGPFTQLLDFCERVGQAANRRIMECLCQCGAFDSFGLRRAQMFEVIESAIARAQEAVHDRRAGQTNFFDLLEAADGSNAAELTPPDVPEWDAEEMLRFEKELLGFYVSGHPLAHHETLVRQFRVGGTLAAREWPDGRGIRLAGVIAAIAEKRSKKDGRAWGILQLEDLDATIDCMVYAETYADCRDAVTENAPVFVEGYVSRRDAEERAKVVATRVVPIAEAPAAFARELHLRLYEKQASATLLQDVLACLERHPGEVPVILCLKCLTGQVAFVEADKRFNVGITPELKRDLGDILGEGVCRLKPNLEVPDRERRE